MPSDFQINAQPKVLLVDDTPANLEVLRQSLKEEGYKISMVTSGEFALKVSPRFQPDLILLDVMMPGLNGYETCRALKKNEETKEIPVIFITAKTNPEDIVEGFEAGGVDYISKPFRQMEVFARVRTQIKLSQLSKLQEKLINDLTEKNDELAKLNDIKNKFMGMAAHDLRNPLGSIQGFSELLINDSDSLSSEEKREFLGFINEISHQMLGMVNDLLDISVIESGHLNLDLSINSFSDLIKKQLKINKHLTDNKSIRLHEKLTKIPNFPFDTNRIGQVLDNLISNAAKFSSPNTNIYVTLEKIDGSAKVIIRDEGPGISSEDQKKLFKGFQKLTPQPTGGEKSTGLGLPIVKKMVEAHKGKLEVESQIGEGSTFMFSLPME